MPSSRPSLCAVARVEAGALGQVRSERRLWGKGWLRGGWPACSAQAWSNLRGAEACGAIRVADRNGELGFYKCECR